MSQLDDRRRSRRGTSTRLKLGDRCKFTLSSTEKNAPPITYFGTMTKYIGSQHAWRVELSFPYSRYPSGWVSSLVI